MTVVKRTLALLLLLALALVLAACGEPATLTQEEVADIYAEEAALRARLVGVTWHYENEPAQAVRFNEDGTAEEYLGATIQWIEPYTFEVRFCNYFDQDAAELTTRDRDYVLKYYEYSVLMTSADEDGSGSTSCEAVTVEGDVMTWGARRYVKGADFVKTLPEGLGIETALLDRVLYDEEANDYRLFYSDGQGFRCNGVFLDGTIHVPEKFSWGVDGDLLYMMIPTQPGGEGPVLQEVDVYRLEQTGDGFTLTDQWTGTVRTYAPPAADSDSGNRLSHNIEEIHRSLESWGY